MQFLRTVKIKILQVKAIYEWKSTSRSVRSARSYRIAFRERLERHYVNSVVVYEFTAYSDFIMLLKINAFNVPLIYNH